METEAKAPDYVDPIAGARSWRTAPTIWARMGGLLWSHAMMNPWRDAEEIVAACDIGHPAPQRGCMCGVWAWKNPAIMKKEGMMPRDHYHASGIVAAAGRVIEGEIGWKAERARVVAFFDHGVSVPAGYPTPAVGDIAEIFEVPLLRFEDYEDFCRAQGLEVWPPRRGR